MVSEAEAYSRVYLLPFVYATNLNWPAANRAYFSRFHVAKQETFQGVSVSIAGSSGNVCAGIFAADGTNQAPLTMLATSGSVACPGAASNPLIPFTQNVTLEPGEYWAAFVVDNTVAAMGFTAASIGGVWGAVSPGVFCYKNTLFPLATLATPPTILSLGQGCGIAAVPT